MFVGFPLIFWLPYSIYVAVSNPDRRRTQLIRITIWFGAVFLVLAINYARHMLIRHNADDLVATINALTVKNGRCPANIGELGISRETLKDKLGFWSHYICEDGKPSLFYGVPFIIYDTYRYDFDKHVWIYRSS